jgi:hypothetical protein
MNGNNKVQLIGTGYHDKLLITQMFSFPSRSFIFSCENLIIFFVNSKQMYIIQNYTNSYWLCMTS